MHRHFKVTHLDGLDTFCCNLSFGLVTKARACEGEGQK
jgi:hypothetical protein